MKAAGGYTPPCPRVPSFHTQVVSGRSLVQQGSRGLLQVAQLGSVPRALGAWLASLSLSGTTGCRCTCHRDDAGLPGDGRGAVRGHHATKPRPIAGTESRTVEPAGSSRVFRPLAAASAPPSTTLPKGVHPKGSVRAADHAALRAATLRPTIRYGFNAQMSGRVRYTTPK